MAQYHFRFERGSISDYGGLDTASPGFNTSNYTVGPYDFLMKRDGPDDTTGLQIVDHVSTDGCIHIPHIRKCSTMMLQSGSISSTSQYNALVIQDPYGELSSVQGYGTKSGTGESETWSNYRFQDITVEALVAIKPRLSPVVPGLASTTDRRWLCSKKRVGLNTHTDGTSLDYGFLLNLGNYPPTNTVNNVKCTNLGLVTSVDNAYAVIGSNLQINAANGETSGTEPTRHWVSFAINYTTKQIRFTVDYSPTNATTLDEQSFSSATGTIAKIFSLTNRARQSSRPLTLLNSWGASAVSFAGGAYTKLYEMRVTSSYLALDELLNQPAKQNSIASYTALSSNSVVSRLANTWIR